MKIRRRKKVNKKRILKIEEGGKREISIMGRKIRG
jgi:hypothetical protein